MGGYRDPRPYILLHLSAQAFPCPFSISLVTPMLITAVPKNNKMINRKLTKFKFLLDKLGKNYRNNRMGIRL